MRKAWCTTPTPRIPAPRRLRGGAAQPYPGTPATAPPAAPPPAERANAYQSCAITQPAPETSLYAPDSVDVSVRVNPALRPGDQLGVLVDGVALQPVGDGATFQVLQPDRGTHTVSAEVRDAQGTVLCSAAAVTFSVQRPSVNTPTSPVKPH